jgi:photosystem II stability/assembly factor-like uncharacterized protein
MLSLPLFEEVRVPISEDVTSVWFTDSLRGFATAGAAWVRGHLLSSQDGGRSWRVDTTVVNRLEHVMFDSFGVGYAVGLHGLALIRWPDDPHWRTFRTDYNWHRSAFFWSYRHAVLVSGEGFQGGRVRKLWPEVWYVDTLHTFVNSLYGVWMTDSLTGCAVGLGWVLRTEDGGRSWQRQTPRGDLFCSVHFPSPRVGYICGRSGTLLKTTDGGRSWQTIRQGSSMGQRYQPFRALWFVSERQGFLVGDGGLFWHTDDGGHSWTPLRCLPANANATSVFVRERTGWITADAGRIYRFEY